MRPTRARVADAVARLRRRGSKRGVAGMARYGITARRAFGVPVADIRAVAKPIGRDHALALALWATGVYEARLLAVLVDDPALVTPAQMDRWCGDFESWADCDTACFHLFDRTPHAFRKVGEWARRKPEFEKRAAFALLASLALHDRAAPAAEFGKRLPLVERAAGDERNFVKKAVAWALRAIGGRDPALHAASVALARRLAASDAAAARWVGRDALADLTRPLVLRRLAKRAVQRRAAAST
jgi:3-methyladenine DNA glycosylase AlkD